MSQLYQTISINNYTSKPTASPRPEEINRVRLPSIASLTNPTETPLPVPCSPKSEPVGANIMAQTADIFLIAHQQEEQKKKHDEELKKQQGQQHQQQQQQQQKQQQQQQKQLPQEPPHSSYTTQYQYATNTTPRPLPQAQVPTPAQQYQPQYFYQPQQPHVHSPSQHQPHLPAPSYYQQPQPQHLPPPTNHPPPPPSQHPTITPPLLQAPSFYPTPGYTPYYQQNVSSPRAASYPGGQVNTRNSSLPYHKTKVQKPAQRSSTHSTMRFKTNKQQLACQRCGITETPEWRKGPNGARTLCNACGLYHAKILKKEGPEAAREIINNFRVFKKRPDPPKIKSQPFNNHSHDHNNMHLQQSPYANAYTQPQYPTLYDKQNYNMGNYTPVSRSPPPPPPVGLPVSSHSVPTLASINSSQRYGAPPVLLPSPVVHYDRNHRAPY